MPITFHTKSYADITFLTDIGKQLIELMDHTPNVPGAILASDLPAALAQLRAGIATAQINKQPEANVQADETERHVTLSHRALPLIALMEAAQVAKENVMWD